jgi:hypothetical protein
MKGLLVAAGLILFASPILGLAVVLGAGGGTGAAGAAAALCRTSGPVRGLDTTQASNARAIVAATQQVTIAAAQPLAAQQRAELIALITAATESELHNYANPTVSASDQLPNDGDPPGGGDHDSVGLFQQRATWGQLADRMNPTRATHRFITRLLAVPAWQTIPPGDAAQAVQGSRDSVLVGHRLQPRHPHPDPRSGTPGALVAEPGAGRQQRRNHRHLLRAHSSAGR